MRGNAAAHARSALTANFLLLLAGASIAPAQEGATPALGGSIAADPAVVSAISMLEEWLGYRVQHMGPPGLSVAVTYRGDVVWANGFGYADRGGGVPATPETVYRGASLTKPITAIAILQLRDAGKLHLDDPVSLHLPWFAATERAGRDSLTAPVRIRDLLTHTAGIPAETHTWHWSDFRFPGEEDIRRTLLAEPPPFEPGEVFKYSNVGFYLLGKIVEAVSGHPYAEYVQRQVLDPLGMRHSTVRPAADHPGLAVGYDRAIPGRERSVMPFSDVRALTPAAGLATTVLDLARLAAYLSGYRSGEAGPVVDGVLSRASVREMTRAHFVWPGWSGGYGLGMMILHAPRDLIGHLSLLNGYAAVFFFDPATGVGVVALGNALDAELLPGGRLSVADRVFDWLTEPILMAARDSSRPADSGPASDSYRRLAGTYRSIAFDLQVATYMGDLVIFNPLRPPAAERLTRLIPEGEDRFRAASRGDDVASPGAIVEFVGSDASGRATRIRMSGFHADRLR